MIKVLFFAIICVMIFILIVAAWSFLVFSENNREDEPTNVPFNPDPYLIPRMKEPKAPTLTDLGEQYQEAQADLIDARGMLKTACLMAMEQGKSATEVAALTGLTAKTLRVWRRRARALETV